MSILMVTADLHRQSSQKHPLGMVLIKMPVALRPTQLGQRIPPDRAHNEHKCSDHRQQ